MRRGSRSMQRQAPRRIHGSLVADADVDVVAGTMIVPPRVVRSRASRDALASYEARPDLGGPFFFFI